MCIKTQTLLSFSSLVLFVHETSGTGNVTALIYCEHTRQMKLNAGFWVRKERKSDDTEQLFEIGQQEEMFCETLRLFLLLSDVHILSCQAGLFKMMPGVSTATPPIVWALFMFSFNPQKKKEKKNCIRLTKPYVWE